MPYEEPGCSHLIWVAVQVYAWRMRVKMDWNKVLVLVGECVAVIVLGVLVALGNDGIYRDALIGVAGTLAGTTAPTLVALGRGLKQVKPTTKDD
jgi:hypothetical protein